MRTGRPPTQHAAWLGMLLVLLAAAVPAAAVIAGALPGVRGEAADSLVRVRNADRPAPSRLLVVVVDPRTTQAQGRPPLPRRVYARAITQLQASGARAIGVDVQFTSATDRDDDLALFDAVRHARVPVVLATSQVVRRRVVAAGPVVADTDVLGGRVNLRGTKAVAAHSSVPLSTDLVLRGSVPMVAGIDTFAHALAKASGGPGIPGRGMLIDPTVPATRLHQRSLQDVLAGRVPRSEIVGRTVLIGMVVTGARGDDRIDVAGTSARVFGVQAQAQLVATALAGAPLSAAPFITWLLAAFAAGLSAVAAARRQLAAQIATVVGYAVLIPVVCVVAVRGGWLVDPVVPWLVLAFGGGAGIAYRAAEERRARAQARATLGRFVPQAVVAELLRDGSDGRIAPHAQTATVMFCDLRGYTALAAGLARPAALVEVLDAYLGAVSRVVYAHGGTVVSFQGDGVMTAFGVPVDDHRAAQHAVTAARELLDVALPALRLEFREALGADVADALALGIGIATGEVFAGTVGPAERREYAVVGPTTNLAARLQSRTKEEPVPVLIDDATAKAMLGDERMAAHTGVRTQAGPLTPVGPREIRGLPRAVDCWTLSA